MNSKLFRDENKTSLSVVMPLDNIKLKLSWSDIQLFLRCSRCFYVSKKMRIKAVSDFDDHCCSLSSFTDQLLKKEFDHFRKYCVPHPVMERDGVNIKHPFKTRKIDEWRTAWNFTTHTVGGIQFHDLDKNVIIYGGVDDVWINDANELVIVDYKSSKKGIIYQEYIKQVQFYAWILKQKNYKVAQVGYLLMYTPIDKESFDWSVEFDPCLFPVLIDDNWVDQTIERVLHCLSVDIIPDAGFRDLTKAKKCMTCDYFDRLSNKMKNINGYIYGYKR